MLLERLEAILNGNVAQSGKARALVERLDGRSLALAADGTRLRLRMRVSEGRIHIDDTDDPADARLSGTPLALLALAGPQAEEHLRGGGVRIEGDAEVAQRFRELLRHARPDFEEELSRSIGDVAAHQVANAARGFLEWGRRASDSLATSVAEFLQEEGRDVPTRLEVEEYLRAVDTLRNDVDRLEARLQRLGARRT